ncbi:MAG: transcriptional repressor LexA [Lautropia sp.]|nr:transcriptional repressor LexA [Lautropia sp.]
MRPLTPRQLEVLALIKFHLENTGFPPTRAEIAAELGFRSANAAEDHLRALARKGIIELCPGASRGIRVMPAAEAALEGQPVPLRRTPLRAQQAALRGHLSPFSPPTTTPGGMPFGAEPLSPLQQLPLVGRVAAGQPILADSHIESSYSVDAALFSMVPDYLLRIKGASMRDAGMLDGDLLAVKASPDAHNGQIVVARIGNEVTVKRFRRHRDDGTIELLPENPDYEPITLTPGQDEFQIEGIAVGLIRQQPGRYF